LHEAPRANHIGIELGQRFDTTLEGHWHARGVGKKLTAQPTAKRGPENVGCAHQQQRL
jgi:hypothetical protein